MFEAVVDGKVVTLKTNSKFSSVISSLEPGHVQELRYNGDYVTGVKTPAKTTQYWGYDEAVNASRRIDKEEIYDIGHDWTTVVAGSKSECGLNDAKHESSDSAGNPYVTKRGHLTYSDITVGTETRRLYEASDLKMIGNTMYFQPDTKTFGGTTYDKDSGLAIVNGAPAVVIHKVDGDTKKIECSSVAQAIAELGDPEVTTTAKEFAGRIVAVLNDQGAAKWVVFISDTEVTTKGEILTGNNCSIKVRKILNVGNGITDELEPELRTVSTTALTSGYWTVSASPVAGYTPITPSKTVTYVKGVREYEVSFTYVKSDPYVVSFDGNTSDGGTAPAAITANPAGSSITLPAAGFTKTGSVFVGWGRTATDPAPMSAGTVWTPTSTCTLYAIWGTVYTVTYNANNGTGTANTATQTQSAPGAAIALVADNNGFTRTGYAFDGWTTTADDATTKVSGNYVPTASENLYALWAELFDVTFDWQGATGTYVTGHASAEQTSKGASVAVPNASDANVTPPTGKTFKEWNTAADGTGDAVTSVIPTTDMTIYAIWQ